MFMIKCYLTLLCNSVPLRGYTVIPELKLRFLYTFVHYIYSSTYITLYMHSDPCHIVYAYIHH